MSVTAIREMVMLPENRPAMLLLLRSSVAMCSVPVAVYYFCFDVLFGPQGWIDLSHDLNWRVNYSGFAAIAAVQLVVFWHVVSAFRQDASDMTREAEIKEKLKAARAAQATTQSEGASSSKKDS